MNPPDSSSAVSEARRWLARLRTCTAAEVARSGRLDEAATYLAPGGDPAAEDDATLDLLARIRAQQGRLEEAAGLWEVVLSRDPGNAAARAALARVESLRPGTRASPRRRSAVPAPRPSTDAGVPVAVVTTTVGGVIVAWDDGAARLFGRAADHALGSPVAALFSPTSRKLDELNLAEVRAGEAVLDCVAKLASPAGARRGTYDMEPVLDAAGRLVAVRRTIRLD